LLTFSFLFSSSCALLFPVPFAFLLFLTILFQSLTAMAFKIQIIHPLSCSSGKLSRNACSLHYFVPLFTPPTHTDSMDRVTLVTRQSRSETRPRRRIETRQRRQGRHKEYCWDTGPGVINGLPTLPNSPAFKACGRLHHHHHLYSLLKFRGSSP
jgi:hypothetical protein